MLNQLPPLTEEIKPLLSVFKNRINKNFPDTDFKIVLFGSYARGEQYEESDIDILLLFKEISSEKEKKIFEIKSELTYEHEKYFSVITEEHKQFEKANTPLYHTIKKEGVEI